MELRKVGISALTSIVLGLPSHVSADLLEEFSRTRAFAYETSTIMKKSRESHVALKEELASAPSVDIRRQEKLSRAKIDRLIHHKARSYGINPDFIRAVVQVESGFDVFALSPTGAMGLMQLMPKTASTLRVQNPWNPGDNLEGGIRYMAGLLLEFRDVKKALIAYNAGPEVVRKRLELPNETRRYVRLVLHHFRTLKVKQGEKP